MSTPECNLQFSFQNIINVAYRKYTRHFRRVLWLACQLYILTSVLWLSVYCYEALEISLFAYTKLVFCSESDPSLIYACFLVSAAAATPSSNKLLFIFVIVTATTYTVLLQYLDSLSAFSSLSAMMASRSSMGLGKTLLNRGFRGYTTSTTPKMKAYAPTADYGYAHHHPHQQGKPSRYPKGDFVPVYVAIGMIALSTGLGLHTAWQQLRNSPTVRVKKQRRETLPEVVEPEHVVEEADKFFKHSFFRKVAHVQGHNNPDKQIIPDPIRKDAYAYRPHVETLKSVGVDPSHV